MEVLDELKQAEAALTKDVRELASQYVEPLTFKGSSIETGVLWIPPFEYDFWSWRRKKPKPNKCICTCCGNKHNVKGGN